MRSRAKTTEHPTLGVITAAFCLRQELPEADMALTGCSIKQDNRVNVQLSSLAYGEARQQLLPHDDPMLKAAHHTLLRSDCSTGPASCTSSRYSCCCQEQSGFCNTN
jgi:hypothetical protein